MKTQETLLTLLWSCRGYKLITWQMMNSMTAHKSVDLVAFSLMLLKIHITLETMTSELESTTNIDRDQTKYKIQCPFQAVEEVEWIITIDSSQMLSRQDKECLTCSMATISQEVEQHWILIVMQELCHQTETLEVQVEVQVLEWTTTTKAVHHVQVNQHFHKTNSKILNSQTRTITNIIETK